MQQLRPFPPSRRVRRRARARRRPDGWGRARALAMALVLVLGLAGTGLVASSAQAVPFTLTEAVSFSFGNGAKGTILPVTDLSGTPSLLGGTVSDPASQDWLVFQIALDGDSDLVDQVQASVVGVSAVAGAGHFPDPDESPTGGAVEAAPASRLLFDFAFQQVVAANLTAGETSDRLIAAFAAGSLPGDGLPFAGIDPGTASFGISSGANESIQATIVQIPEPSLALLLAAAGGLARLGRPRRGSV